MGEKESMTKGYNKASKNSRSNAYIFFFFSLSQPEFENEWTKSEVLLFYLNQAEQIDIWES